jgi:hypothetical protein
MVPIKKTQIYKKLKCPHPECMKRIFQCASLLRLHDDLRHKGIFHFVCDHIDTESGKKCDQAFETNSQLTAHKKRHSDVRPYKCIHIGCDKAFKTNCDLSEHQKRHSEDRPFKCTHIGCVDAFTTNGELQSHWLRVHAPDDHPDKIKLGEKYKCEDCGDRFLHSCALKEHRLTTHTAKDDPGYIAYRDKKKAYRREKYATDEEFRVSCRMRGAMYRIFERAGKDKDASTELLLGVSYAEAVAHLNNNTRGLKVSDRNIHIDHIRPIASFNLKKCKMEILQCSNINNLQLLPGPENNDKRARFNDADKEAYEPIRKIIAALMPAWLARGECSCGECM